MLLGEPLDRALHRERSEAAPGIGVSAVRELANLILVGLLTATVDEARAFAKTQRANGARNQNLYYMIGVVGIVAGLVRTAVDQGKHLSELTDAEVMAVAPQLNGGLSEVLSEGAWLESKVSEGGTALDRVREQLAHARAELDGQPA